MLSVVHLKGFNNSLIFHGNNRLMKVSKEVRQVEVQEQCAQLSVLLTRLELQILVVEEIGFEFMTLFCISCRGVTP